VCAATSEFAARGFHHTSVEDIVRTAHVSRTAFYAFFDNREDAMYGALHASLRGLLNHVRRELKSCRPEGDQVFVLVASFVDWLVARPAEARVILIDGVGISDGVNSLRSRMRSEMVSLIRDTWSNRDRDAAGPDDETIAVGVFGMLFESLVDLVECDRLREASSRVPTLVEAIKKVLLIS
jgi:AcrR family transcriptional regulator